VQVYYVVYKRDKLAAGACKAHYSILQDLLVIVFMWKKFRFHCNVAFIEIYRFLQGT
jgi:hypothetical protein